MLSRTLALLIRTLRVDARLAPDPLVPAVLRGLHLPEPAQGAGDQAPSPARRD